MRYVIAIRLSLFDMHGMYYNTFCLNNVKMIKFNNSIAFACNIRLNLYFNLCNYLF